MTDVVMGLGEVGAGLLEALRGLERPLPVYGYDLNFDDGVAPDRARGLHIATRYGPQFRIAVAEAIVRWHPEYVVVHSTVPIGTCGTMGGRLGIIVHSPVRGDHGQMALSLRTFAKYVAGPDAARAAAIAAMLEAGIPAVDAGDDPRVTEAQKLIDLTNYAWQIAFTKEVDRLCARFGLPFDQVYRQAQETYNDGYRLLGRPNVARPILEPTPGPIGGHCVMPAVGMLTAAFPPATWLQGWHRWEEPDE